MKFLWINLFAFSFGITTLWAQEGFQEVSGCQEEDYIFADIESSVAFSGMSYTPKCLKVLAGSQVTVAASPTHPLLPQDQTLDTPNPITETEQTQTYTFDQPGFYGYFCDRHGDEKGRGMAGTIWVISE